MANNNNKLKTLYIMKILLEKTDEDNPITVKDIINELYKYGISSERKSIYTDIEMLNNYGLKVACVKQNSNKYYISNRDFEVPELKILVDAVQFCRFVSHEKSNNLISKLERLASSNQAKSLHRQVVISDRVKTNNESIYDTIDSINNAIKQNKMISFKYLKYNVQKKLVPKNNGIKSVVSPYNLAWNNGNYYLIGYYEKYKKICHFRVDKMDKVSCLETSRYLENYDKFKAVEYCKKCFKMFGGDAKKVDLEFHNSLLDVVVDKFGTDVCIYGKNDSTFKVYVDVAVSNPFFGWLMSFGDKVKILKPEEIQRKFVQYLRDTLKRYNNC